MCQPRGLGRIGNHSRSMQDCSLAPTAAVPLPPFHQQPSARCCEQEGLSPTGMCCPCSGGGEADQSLQGEWLNSGSLPSLQGSRAQHPGEEATCSQQLSGLSRAGLSGRGAARLALGEQHTLCS